jgi:hypothetical protein
MACVHHAVQGALRLLVQRTADNVILASTLELVSRAAFLAGWGSMATPLGFLHVWPVRRRSTQKSLDRLASLIVNASKAPTSMKEPAFALIAIKRHGWFVQVLPFRALQMDSMENLVSKR